MRKQYYCIVCNKSNCRQSHAYGSGKCRSCVKKDIKLSKFHKKTISDSLIGHIPWNKNKRMEKTKGSNHWNWKNGLTNLRILIKKLLEYKQWRTKVFERDNYTCQECFNRGLEIHPHHKKPFRYILKEFLNFYNQFSLIEDKETLVRLAITWEDFWDIGHGITLCKECHINITYKNLK